MTQTKKNQKEANVLAEFIAQWGLKFLFVSAVILLMVFVVIYSTLFGRIEQSKKLIEIEQGQTYYELIAKWDEDLPLFSSVVAKSYIKWSVDGPLYVGTYQIPKNPNFLEMMQVLQQGAESALVKIQIIEGRTADDLYQKLEHTKNIKLEVVTLPREEIKQALAIDPYMSDVPEHLAYNLEGWFAPNTYLYAEGTSDKDILRDLYKRQQHLLDVAWKNRAENLPYKSKYQALIMASIIEKETGLVAERAEVAGVFVNRLRKGMRLQTDPTIIYGMGDRYDGNITRKDINEKTDYNTYQIHGLPPTPIALPSVASIDAALHPAETESLFFVATGNGGHKFSKTYTEHKKAVQEYLKVMKQKSAN